MIPRVSDLSDSRSPNRGKTTRQFNPRTLEKLIEKLDARIQDYRRLQAAGKPFKVAITAVMRKLLSPQFSR